MKIFCYELVLTVLFALSFFTPAFAQDKTPIPPRVANTIELFKQGDESQAIGNFYEIIKNSPNDINALYQIGVFCVENGVESIALEAFERLSVLKPESAEANSYLVYLLWIDGQNNRSVQLAQLALKNGINTAQLHFVMAEHYRTTKEFEKSLDEINRAIAADTEFALAHLTKYNILMVLNRPNEAAESLQGFLQAARDDLDAEVWANELAMLRKDLQTEKPSEAKSKTTDNSAPIITGSENKEDEKLTILQQPRASYNERARRAGYSAQVALKVAFGADGKISNIRIVQGAYFGLTTLAIEAAQQIKFQPAIKDGKPITVVKTVVYHFNLIK